VQRWLASPGEQPCGSLGYLSNDASSEQIVSILLSIFWVAAWLLVWSVACVLMVAAVSQGIEVPVCLLHVVLMTGFKKILRPSRKADKSAVGAMNRPLRRLRCWIEDIPMNFLKSIMGCLQCVRGCAVVYVEHPVANAWAGDQVSDEFQVL
jgi:hypothetical protein